MMIKLILLLTSISSFAQNIDYEMQPFVNDFVWNLESTTKDKRITNRIKNLIVKFGKIEDVYKEKRVSGFCYYDINTVILDKQFFLNLPDEVKQEAIDHELGHCLLGLIHNEDIAISAGIEKPESIMYPSWFAYNLFLRKDFYRKQIFNDKKNFFKLKKQYKQLKIYRHAHNGKIP